MMTFSSVVELRFPRRGNVGWPLPGCDSPGERLHGLDGVAIPRGERRRSDREQGRSEALHMKRLTLG